jgi:hypothetical protein
MENNSNTSDSECDGPPPVMFSYLCPIFNENPFRDLIDFYVSREPVVSSDSRLEVLEDRDLYGEQVIFK